MSYDPTTGPFFVKLVDGDGIERWIPISQITGIRKIADDNWQVYVGDNSYATAQNVQTFIDALGSFN